jgi:ribosome recycling factor
LSSAPDKSVSLVTPDGRYVVVRGRLWRAQNPDLTEAARAELVKKLMQARRQLRGRVTQEQRAAAREIVNETKVALGERGPVWWSDNSRDLNRHMVKNTPYAQWFIKCLQTENG